MKTKSLPKTRSVLALLAILGSFTFAYSSDATPMLFTLTGVTLITERGAGTSVD